MFNKNYPNLGVIILRLGLGFVYLWFGISQLLQTAQWVGFIPDWALPLFGGSAVTAVLLNGWFEIIAGAMLAFGIYIRQVASLLAVHLTLIVFDVGLSAIGVRDIGLVAATVAVIFLEPDCWTLYCPVKK